MKLLTDEFLAKYPNQPNHMNQLASFVFYRTYSRFNKDTNKRETFKESIARAVEYNMQIAIKEWEDKKITPPIDKIRIEAETLFDNIFNLRQFLSGRTHWVGGTKEGVANLFPTANFNCAFTEITSWKDIIEVFYLLLVGTGVGIGCTKENADKLPPIRRNFKVIHSDYNPIAPEFRLEHTKFEVLENGYAKMYVGDSKDAWVKSLEYFFEVITNPLYENIHTIKISYNSIRLKGERLKTFGGTASGHESLRDMFIGIEKVIRDEFDAYIDEMRESSIKQLYKVRPIHIMDICNLIGNNVVVGGVRRTAEIFLFDVDDYECMFAKYGINGIWNEEKHLDVIEKAEKLGINISLLKEMKLNDPNIKPLHSRRMSNNSIRFTEKPSQEVLDLIFALIKGEGEPGFVNIESALKRRPNAVGLNPCSEILLDSKGLCNLTTVNVSAFVKENDGVPILDFSGLAQAQSLSTRAGIRMTCLDLELEDWDKVQKRDRLIGCSLTGWKDAMDKLGYSKEQEESLLSTLRDIAHETAQLYSYTLRIPMPLLVTTIKPEGTLSQVANGVSSGLHKSYAQYYIRRIRINANDPLVEMAKRLNWTITPEVGQELETASTLVIDFPVKSNASKREDDSAVEQLDNYFMFQEYYTDHNSSNTIYVKDDEWDEVQSKIMSEWDNFIGVSFLSYDGGTYQLAPYEEIDENTFNSLSKSMKDFDIDLLHQIEKDLSKENIEAMEDVSSMESCSNGVCPLR